MKKITLIALLSIAFFLGYGFNQLTRQTVSAPRVTGIGGIFFKAKDPAALKAWYEKTWVCVWCKAVSTSNSARVWIAQKSFTLWVPFNETTKYFQPSDKQFMIDYRA